jgi:hypothetical protein
MGHRFCWMAVRTLGSVRFEPRLIHVLQNRPDTPRARGPRASGTIANQGNVRPAAIEDVHPQCGRELCALACVNMSGTQEPSWSSDDDFPVPWLPAHPPAAPGPREMLVEARCVDPWRSASRLGVRSTRPCARDVPRPGRGTVRHAAVATVPRHS